jgi:uncharacterized membrane protein YhaH (DUF805 family)
VIISGEQARNAGSVPIRPSRLWYWVAGCVLAGAVACFALAVAGFAAFTQQINGFQRVSVPGQAVVAFAHPGGYVLYIEGQGQISDSGDGSGDGSGVSAPFPGWSMDVRLQPVNGGPPVSMSTRPNETESYSGGGHQGQAAMYFTIGHPGRYVLTASNVTPSSITDVAVGRGIGRGILSAILLLLAGLVVLTPAGLSIGAVTAYRRRRARRGTPPVPHVMVPTGGQWPRMNAPGGYPADPYPSGSYPVGPYPSGSYQATAPAYLHGGPVGFGAAIKQALRNGFVYRGRASRSGYWWFTLFQVIVAFTLEFLIFIPLSLVGSGGSGAAVAIGFVILVIVFIYLGLVGLALLVRRLHDTDMSGWWVLIGLVPFGVIVLLIFTLLEGTPGPNRYQPTRIDQPPARPPTGGAALIPTPGT